MEISFVRTQGQPDRVYVKRTDGTEVSWSFPTYGDGLPHDLVHLVVESAFGLGQGFWGRVDAGVDVAKVNAQANRSGGADKYRGFGEDRREILLAEALAGLSWMGLDGMEPDPAALADGCAKAGVEVPRSFTPERVAEVRAVLDALRARWRTMVPKGALRLAFDPKRPEASFDALREG